MLRVEVNQLTEPRPREMVAIKEKEELPPVISKPTVITMGKRAPPQTVEAPQGISRQIPSFRVGIRSSA